MDQYELIRTAARVYQKSIRQIARETGHTRKTIRKVLAGWEPKYRRRHEPASRVMDSVSAIIEGSAPRGSGDPQEAAPHSAPDLDSAGRGVCLSGCGVDS